MAGFVTGLASRLGPKAVKGALTGGKSGFKKYLGQGAGTGAALGGTMSGVASGIEDWRDRDFDGWDMAKDVGLGMLAGGLGGGIAGLGLKRGGVLGTWGGIGMGATGLGSGVAQALDFRMGPKGASGSPMVDQAVQSLTGPSGAMQGPVQKLPWELGNDGAYFGDLGDPEFGSVRSLEELYSDPGLQRIANDQIIQSNAAIMREQDALHKARNREVQAAKRAGEEFQIQAASIGRDNAADTAAIINASRESQKDIEAETDASFNETEAALAGNDYTSDQHRQEADLQNARQNAARISDQELLERLGLANQDIIGELAAAEAQADKNDIENIRTSYNDKIAANRTTARDAWRLDKPVIMGSLVQNQQQFEAQQRQSGLNEYQIKLQKATALRDAQQRGWETQVGMQAQGSEGALTQAQAVEAMSKGSGIKVKSIGGETVELPIWWNSPALADQLGVPADMRQGLENFLSVPEHLEQITGG